MREDGRLAAAESGACVAPADGGDSGALPGVAVLVPVRDEAAALPAALGAIAAQDYAGPIEVVVADASATAATAAAARAAMPGVRIVRNPGGSAAAGMNAALAASAHPVVVRCDARCVLPPEYVRVAVATLRRTGAANVGGRLAPVGRTWFECAAGLAMVSALGSGAPRYRRRRAGPGPVDTVPLGVFRRAALDAVGGFDGGLARNEDYELNWRLRRWGGVVWFDPALAVGYRPRGGVGALARQYFDYGRWKRAMLLRHPRALRLRQTAAPALVTGLAASAAAALAALAGLAVDPSLAGMLLGAAALVPGAWLAALAVGSVAAALGRRRAAALAVALPLTVMHLAWGAGFLTPFRRVRGDAAEGRR